ncbi:ATP-dependent protease La [Candidozyma auris]|nr:ATP-dependent protease La [[Candida] auris]
MLKALAQASATGVRPLSTVTARVQLHQVRNATYAATAPTILDINLLDLPRSPRSLPQETRARAILATDGTNFTTEEPTLHMKKKDGNDGSKKSPEEPAKEKKKEPEPAKDVEPNRPKESGSVVAEATSTGGTSLGGSNGGGNNNSNNNNNNNNNNDNDDDHSNNMSSVVSYQAGSYPPLLAIAMKDKPPLPGRPFSINISDPAVKKTIIEICDRREPHFVLFHMKDPEEPDTDIINNRDSVYTIGVHCYVQRYYEDGPYLRILGYPMERCRLEKLTVPSEASPTSSTVATDGSTAPEPVEEEDFPTAYLKTLGVSYAKVSHCKDEPYDPNTTEFRALIEDVKNSLSKMARVIPNKKDTVRDASNLLSSPHKLADFIGSTTSATPKKVQEMLEELNVEARLQKALELFKNELEAYTIAEKTMKELSSRADEAQTKQIVKEYIKGLQKNAGLVEQENSKTRKFDERLKHLKLSEEAMEAYNSEKAKMESQNEHSSELAVSERYLDWLTSIPWGVYSKDRFEVKLAKDILDRDHYGLKEVKERILEFISMGKVSGKVDGKILCLTGPPGTGKTSIAKSIAEALDRRYVRIAMGGIQDVHEVKGHRRTYIGSIPGRIISALKSAKTSNPLMLIDEIDKLDLSRSGGAASAFLEILDPEQNNAFVDNYIDVKVDLSKVLFVCTANYLGNIPAPLRDRMEIIDVSGYTNNEKLEIATRHLVPQAAKKAGLSEKHVSISPAAITRLIEKYCRESGLRNVKKLITRIFSKASLKIVEMLEEKEAPKEKSDVADSAKTETVRAVPKPEHSKQFSDNISLSANDEQEEVKPLEIPTDVKLEITPEVLKDYVGPEIYTRSRVYDIPPPGVATGLSYSTSGNGDALYIESILTHAISSGSGHAGMHVTGHLKDVMKESASIAYSFAKSFLVQEYPENRFFEAADIHVHCPDGAIPKDGPSAGISFTSSLISLALNKALPPTIAMTGEITLTGKVLPVGGLREKILGAKRYGCDTIIFPKDIENELEEIPKEVKEGVKFIPVSWYSEVFDAIFPDVTKEDCNNVWKKEFELLDEKKKKKDSN